MPLSGFRRVTTALMPHEISIFTAVLALCWQRRMPPIEKMKKSTVALTNFGLFATCSSSFVARYLIASITVCSSGRLFQQLARKQ